jgi:ABC-2 type transport system permease protein
MTAAPSTTGTRTATLGTREPRARFLDLVAAEWIKLRSLRSTWIAYGSTAAAVLALNGGIAYDTASHWDQSVGDARADFLRDGIPLQEAFNTNAAMVMLLALGAIGAMTILTEYSSGTIRTTFSAVPARRAVMTAKATVLATFTTLFGALLAAASFTLTQAILDTRDAGVSISAPGALRVVIASALPAPVCALAGMALGTIFRQTASTMIAVVGVLIVAPIMLSDDRHWSAIAAHTLPFEAWLRLVEVDPVQTKFPWTTTGAWTVYAAWLLAAAILAITTVHRRDH